MVGRGWSLQEEELAVLCGLTETHSGNFLGAPVHAPPFSNKVRKTSVVRTFPDLEGICGGRSNSLAAMASGGQWWPLKEEALAILGC